MVVGTGSLGGAIAKAVRAFYAQVIGVNRHGGAVDYCDEVVTSAELESVLPQADYVFLAVPDTPGHGV